MSDMKTLTINGKTYDIRNKYLDVLNGTNDLSKVELSLGTSGQRFIDFQKSDSTATRLEIQDNTLKTRAYSDGNWTTQYNWYAVTEYNSVSGWYVREWSNGLVEEYYAGSGSGTFTTWNNLAYLNAYAPAPPITGTLLSRTYGGNVTGLTTWCGGLNEVYQVRFLTQGAQSGSKSYQFWIHLVYKI